MNIKAVNNQSDPWTPGWTFLDDYVIERQLGEGGMGTVYLVSSPTGGQFAVKTLLESTLEVSRKRRQFLRELRTWIDLPDHENLTTCLFFQTVEDRLAIFSEYIDGGSLDYWIRENRMVNIRDILDVSIQIGRGLCAAHTGGVVHQDIKPSNILMSTDGIAKLTDFGLSSSIGSNGKNLLDHSSGRMSNIVALTLKFCSPEQLAGSKIDFHTDIWSWGLVILEMLLGEARWKIGAMAPMLLEIHRETKLPPYPGLSPETTAFLDMCFQEDPGNRWPDAETAVTALISIYQTLTGEAYPREDSATLRDTGKISSRKVHVSVPDGKETNPAGILRAAMVTAGYSQDEIDHSFLPFSDRGGKTQGLIDLELLEKAESILNRLLLSGVKNIREALQTLYCARVTCMRTVKDLAGAVTAAEKSLALSKELYDGSPDPDHQLKLANHYCEFGLVLGDKDDREAALVPLDHAIEIVEKLRRMDPDNVEILQTLSRFYTNRSISAFNLGRHDEAKTMSLKLIEIRENLYSRPDTEDMTDFLVRAYLNHTTFLLFSGETRKSLNFFEKAIRVLESILQENRTHDQWILLARTHFAKATTMTSMGLFNDAATLYRQAADIYTQQGEVSDDTRIQDELIKVFSNQAYVLSRLGLFDQAVERYTQVTETLEELVYRRANRNLYPDLALTYFNHGHIRLDMKEYATACSLYRKAHDTWENLVEKKGRQTFEHHVVNSRVYGAWTDFLADGNDNNRDILEDSITQLEGLSAANPDNETDLARAKIFLADVLGKSDETTQARELLISAVAGLEKALEKDRRFDTERDYELAKNLLEKLEINGSGTQGSPGT